MTKFDWHLQDCWTYSYSFLYAWDSVPSEAGGKILSNSRFVSLICGLYSLPNTDQIPPGLYFI